MEISNAPKFLDKDLPNFNNILKDLFPKIMFDRSVDDLFQQELV